MVCRVIIPIKPPHLCKSRLRSVLGDAAREDLVARMLAHVVATARAAPGVGEVLLLGPAHPAVPGLRRIDDPGGGLNAALAFALRAGMAAGVDRLLVVSADLPRITAADIAALVALPPDVVGIALDLAGAGTNALSLPLPRAAAFAFRYGPGSRAAHTAEAGRLHCIARLLHAPTIGFDVDMPADLAALERDDVGLASTRSS